MSDKMSRKFHPIPSTLDFSCYYVISMATEAILKIPKEVCTSTHSAEHSCEVWISIRNIIIYLETKFRPNMRIFVFWWSFWIQNGHHSKPKCFHGNCGKVCPTDSDSFWLISFHQMWMLFLSSFINFCLASNLL